MRGALARAQRTARPRPNEIDWDRTIRKNLRHYSPEHRTVIAERVVGFARRRSALRDVVLCVDQSGSMAGSVVYSSIFGAVLASLRSVSTRFVLFDTAVVDLTDELRDPVDLLFGTQLGGGTDINRALAYCQQLITRPAQTILVLITDLYEGGNAKEMLARAAQLKQSGVTVVCLLALSDQGAPAYDHDHARSLAVLGIPAFACTPDLFPELRGKAKLDLIANAFGTGEVFEYIDGTRGRTRVSGSVPTRRDNQNVTLEVPPIWVPQLSIGIRFADRLRPRIRDSASARRAAGPEVEDAMSSERWDVELDAVYYFTSVRDQTRLTTYDAEVLLRSIGAGGTITETPFSVGECLEPDPDPSTGEDSCPKKKRRGISRLGGRDQISLRLGGDYNPLPGLLALRAGVSYETDGQDVELYQPLAYMLSRFGLHCGLTVRVARKTDISIGFAHFFQRDVRLQVNPDSRYPRKYKSAAYNFAPGRGEPDAEGQHAEGGDFDGIARLDLPNGDNIPGPHFVNAGSFTSELDVVSLSFTQHF